MEHNNILEADRGKRILEIVSALYCLFSDLQSLLFNDSSPKAMQREITSKIEKGSLANLKGKLTGFSDALDPVAKTGGRPALSKKKDRDDTMKALENHCSKYIKEITKKEHHLTRVKWVEIFESLPEVTIDVAPGRQCNIDLISYLNVSTEDDPVERSAKQLDDYMEAVGLSAAVTSIATSMETYFELVPQKMETLYKFAFATLPTEELYFKIPGQSEDRITAINRLIVALKPSWPQLRSLEAPTAYTDGSLRSLFTQIGEALDFEGEPPRASLYGLIFNDETFGVSRTIGGKETSIHLDRQSYWLLWRIADPRLLLTPLNRKELCKFLGRKLVKGEAMSSGALSTEKSKLSKSIAPLLLEIETVRNVGYRLTQIDERSG